MSTMRVKICGITNRDDAGAAVAAGADMLGFNLYPKSPRYVEPERVKELVAFAQEERLKLALSPAEGTKDCAPNLQSSIFSLLCIGIFVNEPPSRVADILSTTGLDLAQLHGDEAPSDLVALAGRAFKALRPRGQSSNQIGDAGRDAGLYAPLAPVDGPTLLIDAYDPDEYGGTGQRADWSVAKRLASLHEKTLLAGGLTVDNVARAIAAVQPWGVDVSSGVERSPGVKDHALVRAFVAAAHSAAAESDVPQHE